MTPAAPKLSVVIAAYNAEATVAACLQAACAQAGAETEIIVVDDCSEDATAATADRFPVELLRLPVRSGVAAARNAGARAARGAILLFLDADVVPTADLVARGVNTMAQEGVDAVIGSYDARPAIRSTVSLFKNLAHHYFHQNARREAATFWGACGFIRRDLFMAAGGFDQQRYLLPSIEDVELGARLVAGGATIIVDRDLQVTHLKRWTLPSLLATDVTRRAIPWTLLALENGSFPADLNFTWRQRLAALTAVALTAALMATLQWSRMGLVFGALLAAAAILNRDLYRLFYDHGGVRLAVRGFLLQQLYYLYSLVGLAAGVLIHCARRIANAGAA